MSVETMSLFYSLLTVAALATVVAGLVLAVARRIAPRSRAGAAVAEAVAPAGLVLAWMVAFVATTGSLYFSEIADFVPCPLCWYQRIAMYPMVVILGIAALRRDTGVRRYVLPVVGMGGLISVYHYVVQVSPNVESAFCGLEASCSGRWVWQFGFVSIPMMALAAFALIGLLVVVAGPSKEDASG